MCHVQSLFVHFVCLGEVTPVHPRIKVGDETLWQDIPSDLERKPTMHSDGGYIYKGPLRGIGLKKCAKYHLSVAKQRK